MRRLVFAPLVALTLVLGSVAGAAADTAQLEMSGYVVSTKELYSAAHPVGDGLFSSHAVVFYEGPLEIGDRAARAEVKVVLERTLDDTFEGTLEGIHVVDLRDFGYGTCRGPLAVEMTVGGGEYPTVSFGSAVCSTGASFEAQWEGAYLPDFSAYRHDIVSGTLALPE